MLTTKDVARIVLGTVAVGTLVKCGDSGDDEEFRGSASGFVKTAEIRQGRQLYMSSGCSLCHGKQGRGDGALAGKYNPRPTDLSDPEAFRGPHDASTLANVIRDGVGNKGMLTMPAYPHLSEKDRRRIAHYIRSLWETEGESDTEHQ